MTYDPNDRGDVNHPLNPHNEESDAIYGFGAKIVIGILILVAITMLVTAILDFWRYWAIPLVIVFLLATNLLLYLFQI